MAKFPRSTRSPPTCQTVTLVIDAKGAWMNPVTHKTIKEPTKILLVALPFDQAAWRSSTASGRNIRSGFTNSLSA